MKMYRTQNYKPYIKEYDVVKETVSFVTFITESGNKSREKKISDYATWHKKHAEARLALTDKFILKIQYAEKLVKQRHDELANFNLNCENK